MDKLTVDEAKDIIMKVWSEVDSEFLAKKVKESEPSNPKYYCFVDCLINYPDDKLGVYFGKKVIDRLIFERNRVFETRKYNQDFMEYLK